MNKTCTKCYSSFKKDKENFRILSNGYWCSSCRRCEKKRNKIWYNANKKKHQELVKKWKDKNPEKAKKYSSSSSRKYYKNNKEKILEKKKIYRSRPEVIKRNNEWNRDRRKDPKIKLKQNVSRAINYALRAMDSSKDNHSIWEFLDYTSEDLKNHIEAQWESWMNWDNYGIYNGGTRKWHVDHIIPQSKLLYKSMNDNNFQKCWSLNNLRPLEAVKNLSDGSRK